MKFKHNKKFGVDLDFNDFVPEFLGAVTDLEDVNVSVRKATATKFVANIEGVVVKLTGQGMNYANLDGEDVPVSGAIVKASMKGAFVASDFRVTIQQLANKGPEGVQTIFDKLLNRADTLEFEGGAQTVDAGRGVDEIFGGAGNDSLAGGGGKDSVFGEEGDDRIELGAGTDTGDGGEGDDVILGGRGKDAISGGDGDDQLFGEGGKDSVTGDDGDDFIALSNGSDTGDGGAGADELVGGKGNDTLTGGTEADEFLYAGPNEGFDVITDFELGLDLVSISVEGVTSLEDLSFGERNGTGQVRFAGTSIEFVGIDAETVEAQATEIFLFDTV